MNQATVTHPDTIVAAELYLPIDDLKALQPTTLLVYMWMNCTDY